LIRIVGSRGCSIGVPKTPPAVVGCRFRYFGTAKTKWTWSTTVPFSQAVVETTPGRTISRYDACATQRLHRNSSRTVPMGRFTGSKIRGVFYPEAIEVMGSAFDAAWHELQNSSQPLTTGELGGRTRYVLAKIIVALIDDGERDPRTLSHKAL